MADEGTDEPEDAESPAPEKTAKKKRRPCERCGTFAKRRNVLGQRLCAECAGKSLHPAADGSMTAGDLLSGSLSIAGMIAVPAMIASLVPDVLGALLGAAGAEAGLGETEIRWMGFLIGALTSPLVTGFTILLGWRALRREPLEPGSALVHAFAFWLSMLGTAIVTGLSVSAYTLLLFVPGLLRSLDVFVAQPVTLLEQRGAVESMDESVARMKPFRGAIFGALLAISFLCVVVCGVVLVPLELADVDLRLVLVFVFPVLTSALQVLGSSLAVVLYTRERLLRRA